MTKFFQKNYLRENCFIEFYERKKPCFVYPIRALFLKVWPLFFDEVRHQEWQDHQKTSRVCPVRSQARSVTLVKSCAVVTLCD